jgi:ubiquinone/menaquinone biosynthesis C-methylase UbiE
MNAEATTFPDNSFDLICGSSILHHLNLDKACAEIRRILRPDGGAVFIEPLGHNPLINMFRKLTPLPECV